MYPSQIMRTKRKAEQAENKDGYHRGLTDLHSTVHEEEGANIREKLIAERRAWFTEQIGTLLRV